MRHVLIGVALSLSTSCVGTVGQVESPADAGTLFSSGGGTPATGGGTPATGGGTPATGGGTSATGGGTPATGGGTPATGGGTPATGGGTPATGGGTVGGGSGSDAGYVAPVCTVSVSAYGAVGNGTANDSAAFVASFAAAGSGGVVCVPAGTYLIPLGSELQIPNDITLVGQGRDVSWIKGHIDFGSRNVFVDLKFGDLGSGAIANRPGANGVRFERCRLRGGPGPVVLIGGNGDASNILFYDTLIERSLGTYDNSVSIIDTWGGSHVTDVTFDHSTIGTSNGIATGASRMGIECWCNSVSNPSTPDHCWENITVLDCTFEVAGFAALDFSGAFASGGPELSGPVVVERNIFKGAGNGSGSEGWDLDLECPKRFTVRDNIFYRAELQAISMNTNTNDNNTCVGKDLTGSVISGNQFRLDVNNGFTSWDWDQITLVGNNFEVRNNTVRLNQGPVQSGQVFGFVWANGVQFVGNTIEDLRTSLSAKMLRLDNTSHNNSVSGNTFITNSGVAPTWADEGTTNVFTGNTLVTH